MFEFGESLNDDDGGLFLKNKSYNFLAIDMLGYCYFNGLGCEMDKKKANEFYGKAAGMGNTTGNIIY